MTLNTVLKKTINQALYWQILLPHTIAYCMVWRPNALIITAFDLRLLLWTKFSEQAKNKKCAFFDKIGRINYIKFILFLISMISVECVN